jgi:SHS2 domain-containing protein
MRYRTLEHTADVMIEAYGRTLEECFANAAYALTDQMVDAGKVRHLEERDITVEGHDHESMLYNLLSEMLFVFDVSNLLLSKFDVKFEGDKVICRAWGETFDRSRHEPKKEVKAITYHMMNIEPTTPMVRVVFDI